MRKIVFLGLIWVAAVNFRLAAQADFYAIDTVQEIRLYFAEPDWDHILDSFFVAGKEERLTGTVVINGDTLTEAGVRYKGFSSASVDRVKNPFNIKLNHKIAGQRYLGVDKIKLSNVIQDPSFIREVLSYEIARKYMPASKANFANVYVNDTLLGLYTNVESVNNEFLEQHFQSADNAFFKCNPEDLDFDGENSNLGNSPGTDIAAYAAFYELQSTSGWYELYSLIERLNENPDNVGDLLNIDRTLWMHAFNYALINFDSYVGYAQNYYLYRQANGQFSPILWDLNMSFASFRFTDDSDYWDGFTVTEAQTIDPLSHYNSFSVYPRPLMRKLFDNATYRRMYLAHIRTIIEENFANLDYYVRAQAMQSLIDPHVAADTNKFYSYSDFQQNLDSTVSDLIDYPGIADLMNNRTTYLQNYPGYQNAPTISNVVSSPGTLSVGDAVTINATVSNATTVTLAYRFSENQIFSTVSMLDDGTQGDGSAGDGVFGWVLLNVGNKLQYYVYAENDDAGRFSPERAAYELYELEAEITAGNVVINEFMALNETRFADPDGEYEDWIELYNNTNADLSLGGLSLTDDFSNPQKSPLPDVTIPAGGYLIVWADGEMNESGVHADFRLNAAGDKIALANADGTLLDSVVFGLQYPVTTTGRYPNGTGSFVQMLPTFEAENTLDDAAILTDDFFIYPNPATSALNVIIDQPLPFSIDIVSADGKAVMEKMEITGEGMITINTSAYRPGLYCLRLWKDEVPAVKKFILTH